MPSAKPAREKPRAPRATTIVGEGGRYVPPSLPLPLLTRTRLLDRIAAAERHRLTLIHADAGYGKTTLLVQYADLLRARGTRAAWLTLHRADEDPLVLIADLVGAVRREAPDFGARILSTLERSRHLDKHLGALTELVAEELRKVLPLVAIIDDHASMRGHEQLATFVNDLIELVPSDAHLVLAMRRTPQLPGLSRWRLHGELLDLSAAELTFTRDEAAGLLRHEFGLDLPEHAIDAIYTRTGGWPAGLRLAAAFVRERGWSNLAEFRGSAAQLYEYFNNEVLARRSRRVADVLLRWSLLDRVEEENVRMITGAESRAVIQQLEEAGLVQRDPEGGYRFQPLFGEFLRARAREMLAPSDIVALHRRFAERAEEQGRHDRAIYHLQQAAEYERAERLVREQGEDLLAKSEVTTLQRWLDGFPPGVEQRLPWVLLMRGVLHRVRGDYERALSLYQDAERLFRERKDTGGLGRALIWSGQVLRYLRRPQDALERAREGIECLGEGASLQGAWALHLLGGCYADLGDADASADAHLRADYLFGLLGHAPGQLAEAQAIAQLHAELGNLDEAQRNFLRALTLQQQTGDVNALCWTQAGLVEVRARRGDVQDAAETVQQAIALARGSGFRVAEAALWSTRMLVDALLGDAAASEEAYRAGLDLCRTQGDDRVLLRLHSRASELRALRGDVAGAREALRAAEAVVGASEVPLPEAIVGIARGTVLEAEGQPSAAYAAYRAAAERARQLGAPYAETKCAILAARLDTEEARANEALERALRGVAKEGYRDLFQLRPGLAAWVKERIADLALAPGDAELLQAMLAPPQPTAPAHAPAASRTDRLQVFLLGSFEVRIGGVRVSDRGWRTSKAKELFALLLMSRERPVSRDELMEALWPESDLTSGVSNFHFTMHSLRRALASAGTGDEDGPIPVTRTDEGYRLELPPRFHFDIDLFQASLRRAHDARRAKRLDEAAQHLRSAVATQRGAFLSDLDSPWIEQRREELTRQFLAAARQLAELELGLGNPQGAVKPCERLLEREPYDEEAHRLLMRAYHESGDTALAIRHYEALATLLRRDLDEEPQPATKELYLKLRSSHAGAPRATAKPAD